MGRCSGGSDPEESEHWVLTRRALRTPCKSCCTQVLFLPSMCSTSFPVPPTNPKIVCLCSHQDWKLRYLVSAMGDQLAHLWSTVLSKLGLHTTPLFGEAQERATNATPF